VAVSAPHRNNHAWCNYQNPFHWNLFVDTSRNTKKEDLRAIRYFKTKTRKQWDYDRIDENINSGSSFRDTSQMPHYDSPMREDISGMNAGLHGTPKK